jgi:alpha-glucosidase
LPLAQDYRSTNVETLQQATDSILRLYRELIAIRRGSEALRSGSFALLHSSGNILAYERHSPGERLEIILNLGKEREEFSIDLHAAQMLLSTNPDRAPGQIGSILHLEPNEGIIARLPGV